MDIFQDPKLEHNADLFHLADILQGENEYIQAMDAPTSPPPPTQFPLICIGPEDIWVWDTCGPLSMFVKST